MVPAVITSVITKEAVEDLDVKVGDEVEAIVKSTEVMIVK
jgi:molybdate transport system regulatory protein